MKAWILALGVLAACDDGGTGDPIDADPTPDMDVGCTAGPSYGTVIPLDEEAIHDNVGDVYLASYSLNSHTDLLRLQLNNGVGVFDAGAGGVRTGLFQLSGAETQYSTCGLCVLIFANTNLETLPNLDSSTNIYLATSGSVQLDSVSGTLTGQVTDLQLQHVTIDRNVDFQSTVVGDCTATITSLSFDTVVVEQ